MMKVSYRYKQHLVGFVVQMQCCVALESSMLAGWFTENGFEKKKKNVGNIWYLVNMKQSWQSFHVPCGGITFHISNPLVHKLFCSSRSISIHTPVLPLFSRVAMMYKKINIISHHIQHLLLCKCIPNSTIWGVHTCKLLHFALLLIYLLLFLHGIRMLLALHLLLLTGAIIHTC